MSAATLEDARREFAVRFHIAKDPPMDMQDIEIRLRCAEIATTATSMGGNSAQTAREIYAFVTGKSDQTPREVVDAALDKAGVK